MLVAFGFKVSAAPFHLAAPDAYAGASSPVAGVLATASKAMGFVALFRVLIEVTMPEQGEALLVRYSSNYRLNHNDLGELSSIDQR